MRSSSISTPGSGVTSGKDAGVLNLRFRSAAPVFVPAFRQTAPWVKAQPPLATGDTRKTPPALVTATPLERMTPALLGAVKTPKGSDVLRGSKLVAAAKLPPTRARRSLVAGKS